MDYHALEAITRQVEASPTAGQSLILYGLVKMLSTEDNAVLSLKKLRELSAENRHLAYGLMELYACGAASEATWQEHIQRLDRAITG
jgi:hypothetical protein